MSCPEMCSADTPVDTCLCSVPSHLYSTKKDGDTDSNAPTPYAILTDKTGLIKWIDLYSDEIYFDEETGLFRIKGVSEKDEHKVWKDILLAIGNPGHVGDMYTSAAPWDPLFWLIHPTAERLLHFRRTLDAEGSLPFDDDWGYAADPNAASYTNLVCDWENMSIEGLPTCTQGTCSGHNSDDSLPFTIDGQSWTNLEFYHTYMDASNDTVPYMYDNFQWPACEEQGLEIGSTQ